MANQALNVVTGKPLTTGGVLVAPRGTTLPASATDALGTGFKALGYVGEDGLTENVARTTEKIKAWGGDIVKVVQTDFSVTYVLTLIETLNEDVLETVYGNVTTTPATTTTGTLYETKIRGDVLPHQVFVFEIKDGDAHIRVVVPDGQVTEMGEVTYSDSTAVGYQVTIEAFRDTATDANAIKYLDDGRPSAV